MTENIQFALADAEKVKILSREIKAFEEVLEALKMRLDVVAAVLHASLETDGGDGAETLVQGALELLDIVQSKYFDPRYDEPASDQPDARPGRISNSRRHGEEG